MGILGELFVEYEGLITLLRTIVIVTILALIFNYGLNKLKARLIKRATKKKQRSNIEIFYKIFKYGFFVIVLVLAFFSYIKSWTSLGLTVGLLSAAIGWALQKPITGMAAWIMVVIKRPFDIGDRIIIGDNVKGDVVDISLTHLYIAEIGGIIDGEELSGRIIMVPNSILFEHNIINYTSQDEYVLSQVIVSVTYESDLNKAMKLCQVAAIKHTQSFVEDTGKAPYVRNFFEPSGIDIHVRYFCPARRIQEVASLITKEIFDEFKNAKDVEIAYPHTQIVLPKATRNQALFDAE